MSFPCPSCPVRFGIRIDVQHDSRDFFPIGTCGVGIEQPEVGDYVLLIINSKLVGYRRLVGNIGIEGRASAWNLLSDTNRI
jgi:hypothetical protein